MQTESRGWGLRTTEVVAKNTLLIEYMGEVITMDEVDDRFEGRTVREDFYFASLDRNLVLDAGPMGSDARFAK
jgi:SET domain-containing protein